MPPGLVLLPVISGMAPADVEWTPVSFRDLPFITSDSLAAEDGEGEGEGSGSSRAPARRLLGARIMAAGAGAFADQLWLVRLADQLMRVSAGGGGPGAGAASGAHGWHMRGRGTGQAQAREAPPVPLPLPLQGVPEVMELLHPDCRFRSAPPERVKIELLQLEPALEPGGSGSDADGADDEDDEDDDAGGGGAGGGDGGGGSSGGGGRVVVWVPVGLQEELLPPVSRGDPDIAAALAAMHWTPGGRWGAGAGAGVPLASCVLLTRMLGITACDRPSVGLGGVLVARCDLLSPAAPWSPPPNSPEHPLLVRLRDHPAATRLGVAGLALAGVAMRHRAAAAAALAR